MLEPFEVDAMLFVLEKHFNENLLPLSQFKKLLNDWIDLVEEKYAAEEDVPPWVLHLNTMRKKIEHNMSIQNQCVMYLEE